MSSRALYGQFRPIGGVRISFHRVGIATKSHRREIRGDGVPNSPPPLEGAICAPGVPQTVSAEETPVLILASNGRIPVGTVA